MELKWYIVHTYSGFENRVKLALEEKIKSFGKEDFFGQIIVPTEKVVELVKGKKKTSSRKFYPGYIMIQMALTDETWHMVQDTDKATGFLGGKTKPVPISENEAKGVLSRMKDGEEKPKPKFYFEQGDEVRVIDGPFSSFNGLVEEVKPDKSKLRVLISIFGRSTPVELDFVQVAKI
ncbi:MAG: transcription termination/antitermination protein NusG [Thermodesulfobacteriota bacterium]|nr:transcription termination/antitermination protein NusG [Thermodesulfobacteriota bacterium]